ncbi:hypothetical protein CspHIS471_0302740 [Cutaneotrichosporon sp. HIS471]|nr:hypothetical protein CspHIS471_0302740 [Cutaneotrichosporon sp. HIS471]
MRSGSNPEFFTMHGGRHPGLTMFGLVADGHLGDMIRWNKALWDDQPPRWWPCDPDILERVQVMDYTGPSEEDCMIDRRSSEDEHSPGGSDATGDEQSARGRDTAGDDLEDDYYPFAVGFDLPELTTAEWLKTLCLSFKKLSVTRVWHGVDLDLFCRWLPVPTLVVFAWLSHEGWEPRNPSLLRQV